MPSRRWTVVRLTLATIAVATLALSGCARLVGARPIAPDSPERTTFHTVAVGGQRRGFLLHRPPAIGGRVPVLFVLHGTSANANVVMDESGMNAVADRVGALVVYPNGTSGIPYVRLFWNTEHCCAYETRGGADEVGMVTAIIDSLAARFPIDRTRIGLIGFSDAGSLAYLFACDAAAARVLTTIGVISGELPDPACTPPLGVSTLVFHGTADENIHYGKTAEHVADWAARQRCAASARDTVLGAARTDYTRCGDDAEVELYTIIGGMHAWPGGKRSTWIAPRPSRDVDASALFASFVIAHPRSVR